MRTPWLFLTLLFLTSMSLAQPNSFNWSQLPALPDPVGFAGSYAGVSNGALLVAGGANFPDNVGPWGTTKKTWYDAIYALDKPDGQWKKVGKLPRPMGYGVSLTTPEGILFIGGADGDRHYDDVFLLNYANGTVTKKLFPSLPTPLANASGAVLNGSVYIAGGIETPTDTTAEKLFFRLDFSKPNAQWQRLESWPGPGRMLAVAGAQDGKFFLFSGTEVAQDSKTGGIRRTYLADAYAYNPMKNTWSKLADLPHPAVAAPSPAFAAGQSHLLVMGGDDGSKAAENLILKENHPGFRNEILAYHTLTNTWAEVGQVSVDKKPDAVANPSASTWAPVTTPLVVWHGQVVLPGGEVRPGVRTNRILTAEPTQRSGTFGGFDWGVVGLYFLLVVGISTYVASKMKASTDDFFLGGRNIPWWAAGLSIFGSKLSALTFIAIPAKSYATDWTYILANVCIVLVAPVVVYFFLPYYRKIRITSVYEFLERRFDIRVKLLGSLTFVLFQIGRLGIVIYLPALVLSTVTGINLLLCIGLISLITTAYTISGGIEAVVWTEVMQVVVLMGGAFFSLYFMASSVGGFGPMIEEASQAGKFNLINSGFAMTEPVLWVVLVGNFLSQLTTYSSDQVVVQRYLTTATEAEARQSIWTNALLAIPATLMFFMAGTALWVFFSHNPGQLNVNGRTDDIFPFYISTQLPAGLRGLVIAGLFAATMSTISSSMNSIATVLTTDFYQFARPKATDGQRFRFARFSTLGLGLAGVGIAVWLVYLQNNSIWDQYLKLTGMFGGCLAGMFIAGIFFRQITSGGLLTGFLLSAVLLYFVQTNSWVHFFLYPGIGIVGCVVFGLLFSPVFPEKQPQRKPVSAIE
ncbi:sodium:solute symporter family transporter [Larkinella rosea]|uniref:Sodium:solute symporter n=1 Tax=Larkinella rosea TaxID=2025312 RepID=A0A3P1BVW4_9BACT|nr:sodium/solute symporter [Larkinella rosea]RRB04794.1 sodium:solute symporter [Larkinella rosea]